MGSGTSSLRAVAGSLDEKTRAELIECLSQSQTGPGPSTASEAAVPQCSEAQEATKAAQAPMTSTLPHYASATPDAFRDLAVQQDALSALLVQLQGVDQRLSVMQAAIRGAAVEARDLPSHLPSHLCDGLTLSGSPELAYGGGPGVAATEIAAMNSRVEELLRARDGLLVRIANCAEARDRARAQAVAAVPRRTVATPGLDLNEGWGSPYYSLAGALAPHTTAGGYACSAGFGSGYAPCYSYGCADPSRLGLEMELAQHRQLHRELVAEEALHARELQDVVRRARREPQPGCQPTQAWLHAHDWS